MGAASGHPDWVRTMAQAEEDLTTSSGTTSGTTRTLVATIDCRRWLGFTMRATVNADALFEIEWWDEAGTDALESEYWHTTSTQALGIWTPGRTSIARVYVTSAAGDLSYSMKWQRTNRSLLGRMLVNQTARLTDAVDFSLASGAEQLLPFSYGYAGRVGVFYSSGATTFNFRLQGRRSGAGGRAFWFKGTGMAQVGYEEVICPREINFGQMINGDGVPRNFSLVVVPILS